MTLVTRYRWDDQAKTYLPYQVTAEEARALEVERARQLHTPPAVADGTAYAWQEGSVRLTRQAGLGEHSVDGAICARCNGQGTLLAYWFEDGDDRRETQPCHCNDDKNVLYC